MSILPIDWHPSGRKLAVFAGVAVVLLGALGLGLLLRGRPAAGIACLTLAAAIPILGVLSRNALRALYLLASLATLPLGLIFSWLVLAVVYFVVVTPIGLLLRLAGHDPLSRRLDRQAHSYWMLRKSDDEVERYFQQY